MGKIFSHEGDTIKFQCANAADAHTKYIWLHHRDKLNLTEDNEFNNAVNPNVLRKIIPIDQPHILRLRKVQAKDQGWYTCLAHNASGTTVTKASLKFFPNYQQEPRFTRVNSLVNQLYKASGDTIILSCNAIGYPTPNITWTCDNSKIERVIGKVIYKKWSMRLDDAISKDTGVYKCTVCNALGCIEHSTNVTVIDRMPSRPVISDRFPQNQTVLVNTSTQLECRAKSDLEPYIVWLKYTSTNESIEKLEKSLPRFFDDQGKPTKDIILMDRDPNKPNILKFNKVSLEDEGWYTCVAANTMGQSAASAYLKVLDVPHLDDATVPIFQTRRPLIIVAIGLAVILLFLLGIICIVRNLKREKLLKQRIDTIYQWTKKVIIYKPLSLAEDDSSCDLQVPVIKIEKQRIAYTYSDTNTDPNCPGFNEYEFPLDPDWEIPRCQLSLGSTLGEGAFGIVVKAQLSSNSCDTTSTVAVKMVKAEHSDADVTSLVREMEVMKIIGKHCNIINLLGCCTQNGPLWVIVEYAAHGNLKDFLDKNRPPLTYWNGSSSECLNDKTNLTEKHLLSFALQIACGMEYLASRKVRIFVFSIHLNRNIPKICNVLGVRRLS